MRSPQKVYFEKSGDVPNSPLPVLVFRGVLAPQAAGKVFVLDPSGQDVKDPIGGTQDEYRSTARKLRTLIEKRLAELDQTNKAPENES